MMKLPAILAVAALSLVGCAQEKAAPHTAHASSEEEAPAATAPAGFSIYQLESQWTDQFGRPRALSSLGGRVQLMALVYTNCGYACPRIVGNMKRIAAEVPAADFTLVSIDPERDTPGRLLEFAQGTRLDSARYTLLHGADGDLLELAAALGVRYRRVDEKEFVHSNVITVLDADGNVIHRQEGLDDVESTIHFLHGLEH